MDKIEFSADVTENDEDGIQKINTAYNENMPFIVSSGDANFYYYIMVASNFYEFYWYTDETNGRERPNTLNAPFSPLQEERPNFAFRMQGDWFKGFTIQSKSGKYIAAPNNNTNSTVTTDAPNDNSYFELASSSTGLRFRLKGANTYLAHTSYSGNSDPFLNLYDVSDYIGSVLHFTFANPDLEDETETPTAEVTYNYMLGSHFIGSLTATETVGAAPANVLPEYATPYVTATGAPAVIGKSEGQIYTIETSYNNTLPFNVSSGESNSWYIVNLYDRYYWYSGDATYGTEKDGRNDYGCTVENVDYFLWKIEGNWLDGFRFASRDGRYLAAPTDLPENPNSYNDAATANKACLLSSEEDLAGHEDRSKFYLIHPLNDNKTIKTDEWQLLLKSGNTRLAHTNDPGNGNTIFINFYNKNNNDSYYVGSAVKFDPFDEDFNSDFFNKLPSLAEDRSLPSRAGYPAPETEVAVALREAMANTTYKYFPALKTAWNAYAASTENIVMPEDGKAYYLRNIQKSGNDHLFYCSEEDILKTTPYSNKATTDDCLFVCRALDNGKYIFVSATKGHYVCWRHNDGQTGDNNNGFNNNSGLTETFSDSHCGFSLGSTHSTYPGTFTLTAKRNDGTTGGCFTINSDGTFNAYTSTTVKLEEGLSTLFRLEEADDYTLNNVNMQSVDGGNEHWATLYLPYNTTIPEGIEAYTATLNGNSLKLGQISGSTLPGKTAVVLHSTAQPSATLFVPSTETTAADDNLQNNVLLGTVKADESTPKEGTIYALSGAFNEGIGFYPYTASTLPAGKAYLQLNGTSAPALLFDFGGEVTGIDAAATAAASDAPVYDLSGRRVAGTTKGLYIVGGKKVLVK